MTILVCRLRYSNHAEQTTVYVSADAFLLSAGCASFPVSNEHLNCVSYASCGQSGRVRGGASPERTQVLLTSFLLADLLISNCHLALIHSQPARQQVCTQLWRIAYLPQRQQHLRKTDLKKKYVLFHLTVHPPTPTQPLFSSPNQEFRGFSCVKDTSRNFVGTSEHFFQQGDTPSAAHNGLGRAVCLRAKTPNRCLCASSRRLCTLRQASFTRKLVSSNLLGRNLILYPHFSK